MTGVSTGASTSRRKVAMAEEEDDPPEGLEGLDAAAALGNLAMTWPLYELGLFGLFAQLLGAEPKKCQVIWFSLVSLDVRLRLMRQLASMPEVHDPKGILAALGEAEKLSKQRNRLVHWVWDIDGPNISIMNLRYGQQERRKIKGKHVMALREQVEEQCTVIAELGAAERAAKAAKA